MNVKNRSLRGICLWCRPNNLLPRGSDPETAPTDCQTGQNNHARCIKRLSIVWKTHFRSIRMCPIPQTWLIDEMAGVRVFGRVVYGVDKALKHRNRLLKLIWVDKGMLTMIFDMSSRVSDVLMIISSIAEYRENYRGSCDLVMKIDDWIF